MAFGTHVGGGGVCFGQFIYLKENSFMSFRHPIFLNFLLTINKKQKIPNNEA
jgi:hypothetical protein